MRTTLTLDAEVAVLLKRVIRRRRASLKSVVNEALKLGLQQQEGICVAEPAVRYETSPHDAGKLLQADVASIGELLAREDELS